MLRANRSMLRAQNRSRLGLSAVIAVLAALGALAVGDRTHDARAATVVPPAPFSQVGKLLPRPGDAFFTPVALSGSRALIGGVAEAFVFDIATQQQTSRLATTDADAESFGWSVAINGIIAVVGAPDRDAPRAYVFNATTGGQVSTLNGQVARNGFGTSLAIAGQTVLVGAPDNGPLRGYAKAFNAVTGAELRHIAIPDNSVFTFGSSVAVDAQRYVVGASNTQAPDGAGRGAVYVYDRALPTAPPRKIVPDDYDDVRLFGHDLAVSGNLLVVGAPGVVSNGAERGAAYLFDLTTGAQIAKLLPDDLTSGARFGNNVSIHDGLVVVGARGQSTPITNGGAFYAFNATGALIGRVQPADLELADAFGADVAVYDDRIVATSIFDDDVGNNRGTAYVFAVPEPCPAALWAPALAAALAMRARRTDNDRRRD
jgi:hypothetical protein